MVMFEVSQLRSIIDNLPSHCEVVVDTGESLYGDKFPINQIDLQYKDNSTDPIVRLKIKLEYKEKRDKDLDKCVDYK